MFNSSMPSETEWGYNARSIWDYVLEIAWDDIIVLKTRLVTEPVMPSV
jgi:hypothetical protein